ncbi:MAG: DUF692 domain-containing protein [Deltaproteobacteria bacterium]|nr:DUF692 domain-containing protein [Deltaproteobacteria bacterium]
MAIAVPYLGHGIGLRTQHFPRLWEGTARVDWFEAIAENFMIRGGRPLAALEKARASAPLVLHGVSLSLGSTDPVNTAYLDELRTLIQRFEPAWVSDHLCWGSVGGHYAHDLLPLPYTEEAIAVAVANVRKVQDTLGRQILIENVSSYLTYTHSTMPEWEFLTEIAQRADCGILLDVNNIYVSASNHHFDPITYIHHVPPARVGQIHLAGHSDKGTYLFDTHDGPVIDPVWDLYRLAVRHCGRVSTLVEWDDQIPEFEVVRAEAERARELETEELGLAYARSA